MRIGRAAAREREARGPGSLEPGKEEAVGVKRFAVLLLAVFGAPVCLLATTISRIYLDSRITAKGFYEKLGFRFHTSIPCGIEIEELLGEG